MEAGWQIESFEKNRHDRTGFDCGMHLLNYWLQNQASQYHRKDLARTYVLVEAGQAKVCGYYAISSHAITFDALTEEQAKGLPTISIPTMLIGRLAVDIKFQRKKLGECLLLDALRRSEYMATKMGIRAVEVHAIGQAACDFYMKYGFMQLRDSPEHLFLPMNVIRKLNLSAL